MYRITIIGLASKKILKQTTINQDDLKQSALIWLKKMNIPIASSCDGEGICKKCIINQNILACKTLLKDIIILENEGYLISISYL